MNASDFSPRFPSDPSRIEGMVTQWHIEMDGERTEGDRPLFLTLQPSESGGQAFYEQWVNAFVQSQAKQVAPPVTPAPPQSFNLFTEAGRSAWRARVQLFEDQYPSWVAAMARKAAAWGGVISMRDAVKVFEESRPAPIVFDPLRLHLACFWTTHYLWLMSDMHGTCYLRHGVGIQVTEGAYEKARRELCLIWNRSQRVSGVFKDGRIRF